MIRRLWSLIKKGFIYPSWGNPYKQFRKLISLKKDLEAIPEAKRVLDQQNRVGVAFIIEVISIAIIAELILLLLP